MNGLQFDSASVGLQAIDADQYRETRGLDQRAMTRSRYLTRDVEVAGEIVTHSPETDRMLIGAVGGIQKWNGFWK